MDGRCRHISLGNFDVILPAIPPEWKTAMSVAWSVYIAVLSIWIVMPVAAAKSFTEAAKFVPSPPIHCVWMLTFLPFIGLLGSSAWSSSV